MRILLDSRDLINLVEHQRPATTAEFEAFLRAGNHEIVLCFSNVRELAGPIATGAGFLQVRPLLQSLDQMPHVYLREATIVAIEIQAAVEAFNAGTEYQTCSPYVQSWYETMMLNRQQIVPAERLVLRLDQVVDHISRTRPDVFGPPPIGHLETFRAILQHDRTLLRAGDAPARQHFIEVVKKHAASHRLDLPHGRENALAEWIYENCNRCPGLRFGHETYRALMMNYGDIPQAGDFSDFALIHSIPHVDAVTLDNRMRQYGTIASRKMLRFGGVHDYRQRLFENVTALMQGHHVE